METVKGNQNTKPTTTVDQVLLPEEILAKLKCNDQQLLLATTSGLIKSEDDTNSDELQAFVALNTSILTELCGSPFPDSSTPDSSMFSLQSTSTKGKNKTAAKNISEKSAASSTFETEAQRLKLQYERSRQFEVIKAAKSLFLKRTRTLYRWMYPNVTKQQLNLTLANSWETLSVNEKKFYISQVLGRFGFPQHTPMVNPQLSFISNPAFATLQESTETKNAVCSILNEHKKPRMDDDADDASSFSSCVHANGKRKLYHRHHAAIKKEKLKRRRGIKFAHDEFEDDPELCREFQQFRWAMRMANYNRK